MSASSSVPSASIAVKFLIVDAVEQSLLTVCQAVQRDGLQLITASSGAGALELLTQHEVALAIINVQLPDMSGQDLLARTHVPTILVAGRALDDDARLRGYEAGALDCLQLPLDPIVLQRRTQTFFELAQRQQQLDSAERAKDEFLANLSHEIRTPLNAVLGMTELVLDTALADDQRRLLQTARSAGLHLLATINDLLDFSRIEADALQLEPAEFSLRATVADVLSAFAIRAQRKGLDLICDIQPDVPDKLIGDAGRLRQVMVNLVGNAIKFTPAGEIVIAVSLHAPSTRLLFSVRDTGIGIPRSEQRRIFRAFEQQDMTTTRKYGGTGLGLTIAARLIGLMGGEVRLESEPGSGSNFSFALSFTRAPAASAACAAVPAPEPVSQTHANVPLRVLVAEDHEFNLDFLQTLLATRGHHVELATTGRAALASIAQRRFDLMLLDLHLPELDGFQVIAAIRAAEAGTRRHLPVIAVTARSRAEDRVRCLEAGMDDFLTKPISATALWAVLDRIAAALAPSEQAQLVTPSVLLAACGADDALLGRLCDKLCEYLPQDLTALEEAVNARDAARAREKAHRFAGMLAAFSNSAAQLALDIESHAAERRIEAAAALLPQLEEAATKLLDEIAGLSVAELEKRLRS